MSGTTIQETQYSVFGKCIKLSNDFAEVLITTDVGPRIISYKLKDGNNILGELTPDVSVDTQLGTWHPWGGHRLWHAPEAIPRSYAPDDNTVACEKISSNTVAVSPDPETACNIAKQMIITLDDNSAKLTVTHKITNTGMWDIKAAPWALTIMRPGGTTIIPNEPYKSHADELLPARPLVLWHYTDFSDSRWHLGSKFIRLSTDENLDYAQKVGAMNKQGWAAYSAGNDLFIKKFGFDENADYPDYGCNVETFTKGTFMEVESLGALQTVNPGKCAVHTETWMLVSGFQISDDDNQLQDKILPVVQNF